MNKEIEKITRKNKIRDIITYHSDEGTSGYYLPEDVFEGLIDFIEKEIREAIKQERERIIEGRIKGEERLEQIKHLRSTGMPIKDILKTLNKYE